MIILLFCCLLFYSKCECIEGQSNEIELFKHEMRLEVANLKIEMSKLKDENRSLKTEVRVIKGDYDNLKIVIRNAEKRFSALERKVFSHEKENVNLRNVVDSMLVNGSGTNFPLAVKSGLIFNRQLRSNPVVRELPMEVAFHASLSKDIPLSDNEGIRFDKILTNLANSYDGHTGIFQAPTPGYYVFFVHFLTLAGKYVEGYLMKDADIILYIYAHAEGPASGNHYGPGSNMVVVRLNTGDRVWVKAHEGFHDTGNLLDDVWNTFSGFLLYPAE